jgi:hypothetical protein
VSKINRLLKITLPSFITIVFISAVVVGCDFLPESSFELANDSRLPVWFSLSPGLSRADVSVTMNYYIKSTGRSAIFVLHDKKNNVLGKVTGTLRGSSPVSVTVSSQSGTPGYPSFEVIAVHGVTEVIEHKKMEPKFYLTDDPAVLRALLDAQPQPVNPVRSPK